ncbi:hypothetical protein T440DRAFT_134572 [Plenodomus tracheiphilus IPT5]|uniref:Uncharacterized protein n=1 Tax=Plenodomus tracheiphilus IPT5 TaxID=1408161 RepID=A0A6A7B1E4_9PLEO|nr:hypothetical protein T440DRAFT_134572 [Plenodomus tracheiphilus IPT5]
MYGCTLMSDRLSSASETDTTSPPPGQVDWPRVMCRRPRPAPPSQGRLDTTAMLQVLVPPPMHPPRVNACLPRRGPAKSPTKERAVGEKRRPLEALYGLGKISLPWRSFDQSIRSLNWASTRVEQSLKLTVARILIAIAARQLPNSLSRPSDYAPNKLWSKVDSETEREPKHLCS